jgi:hypothetical protein
MTKDVSIFQDGCVFCVAFIRDAALLRYTRSGVDVEAPSRTHVLVSQDALDRGVLCTQFLEIGSETASVRLPSHPLHAVRFSTKEAMGRFVLTGSGQEGAEAMPPRAKTELIPVPAVPYRLQ